MKRETIAVDVDEVLTPHFEFLMKWYNSKYGTNLTLKNNHPADDDLEPWGVDHMYTARRRVHKFFKTPEFENAKPFKEAKQSLQKLSHHFNLIAVTSRDYFLEKMTVGWLEEHFKSIFDDVHFTARYSVEGEARSKTDVALKAGAEYLIEDSLEHAYDAAGKGIQVLLFGDYPWNQAKKLPPGITRVRNWQEVLQYFDGQK